jgi:hypothetical protein
MMPLNQHKDKLSLRRLEITVNLGEAGITLAVKM